MQTYNQFNQSNVMPLLMNFTTPSTIQEADFEMPSMGYNDDAQISYEMRLLATRSAKNRPKTRPDSKGRPCFSDYKNENDDTKNVR